ncbi:MAG: amidase [Burkholderiales bacterium]
MGPDALHWLEITELAALIQQRKVSPVEVTEAMLRRIEQVDPRHFSYATVTPELALEQARRAEQRIMRREYLGLLHGVPIALKDLCWTAGVRTMAGMPIHRDFVPTRDGTVTERLRVAGSVLLGKLQLTEGAFADHHPAITVPVNPWHRDHWAGASSSGSGVATAAGLCFGSIGSDTGGSIRFPSIANGVTGLKPTWGRVSRFGAFELAASLDHLGPMCRSAADCGLMLGAIAGPDPNDPTASHSPVPDYLAGDDRSLADLTIGVDERWCTEGVEAPVVRAFREALDVLRGLGAAIRPIVFPEVGQITDDWGPNCAVETAIAHERTYPARKAEYGPGLSGFIEAGRALSGLDYQKILLRRAEFRGRVHAVFADVDLMLIPGQPFAAPTVATMATLGQVPEQLAALVRYTAPFDMSGHPTITLPAAFTSGGLPIAVQLVAGHLHEDRLVRAGRAFQRVTDWHRRHPSV